jgi:cobalt-zinc-cadmium efflux system outer membrane protein
LGEREVITAALARPAWRTAEESRLAAAESDVLAASLRPNPVFDVEHERVDAAGGISAESRLRLSQTFDTSGRRPLRISVAEQQYAVAELDETARRLAEIGDVRQQFAGSLHQQLLTEVLDRWVTRLEDVKVVTMKRLERGEASRYDSRRIERERETADARAASARADLARAMESLGGFLGRSADAPLRLRGDLLPEAVEPIETLVQRLPERPDLARYQAQAVAHDREGALAARARRPDVTLGVGPRFVDEPEGSDTGVLLSLELPLPVFDRGQAGERRARAKAEAMRAEYLLRTEREAAALRGVWKQARALRDTAAAFRRDTLGGSRDLSGIAEAAYRGGEADILELLDAYRAELEAETTALDLEWRARLARIELDTLTGVIPHE